MYISYRWLKEFVSIPNNITPEQLANDLTVRTAEVEGVEDFSKRLKNIVTGKILEIAPHPDAEKLNVAKIDIGSKKIQVLFGNSLPVKPGMIIPVSLPGATLPNGITIAKREMRGMMSEGMITVDDELEMELSDRGFVIFSEDTKLGLPLAEVLAMDDVIIEIDNKSLTHRPDLWGHIGMAREVAAIYHKKLQNPLDTLQQTRRKAQLIKPQTSKLPKLSATIQAKKNCSRYLALRIENIAIQPSPKKIASRLSSVGMRPLNNIVDLTNYVMLETGQPLHAFDATKIVDQKIVVRMAKNGERLTTLDGKDHVCDENDLVIADSEKPLALAGVMGGHNSEVSSGTTSIIVEAATFDPVSVRKTAQRLGSKTDASQRFEKSLDPELALPALLRFIQLMKEQQPNVKVTSTLVDQRTIRPKKTSVTLHLDMLNERLGFSLPEKKVVSILESLAFDVKKKKKELIVGIPTFRATKDVSLPEDLVEEVARMYGYDNFPVTLPRATLLAPVRDEAKTLLRQTKRILASLGLSEVYNYSFVHASDIQKTGLSQKDHLELLNPAAEGQGFLRTTLVPGILKNVSDNARNLESFALFELDRVFLKKPGVFVVRPESVEKLPHQPYHLTLALYAKASSDLLAHTKGIVEHLLVALGYSSLILPAKTTTSYFVKGATAGIVVDGTEVGQFGSIAPNIRQAWKIRGEVAVVTLDMDLLFEQRQEKKIFHELPKFPSILRDVAFVDSMNRSAEEYRRSIQKIDPLIVDVQLFDVFRDEKLGTGKRSLAFRIVYQSRDRTLKDAEVDLAQKRVTDLLTQKFQVEIRK